MRAQSAGSDGQAAEMAAGALRGLTFAALKKAHPEMTLQEAGPLLTRHTTMVSDGVAAVYGFIPMREAPEAEMVKEG